jgi:hypothetical protein
VNVTTLMGQAVYERAYYYCPACGEGHFPTDEELRIAVKQTPAAQEVIALIGVLEPFEEGAGRLLPKLCGINVSGSTVQRTTERIGEDVAQRRAAGETIGPEQEWTWHQDAAGQTVAYVSLDATGVLQQGEHAEKAEGRMPWVGAVFNPQPTHKKHRSRRVWETRYVSGLMGLPEVGRQLRRECEAVGVRQADVVIGLTDGGAGLENCLVEALSGRARELVFILDFYHASEHLLEFSKVLLGTDTEGRQRQMDAWCHTLKHRGGRVLYEELQAWDLSQASETIRAAHQGLLGYLRNNLHRMEYPTYVSRGWQIGSGMIESACKTVVGRRLKGSGMRWRERGTTTLCQLRALYRSQPDLWSHYWTNAASA